MDDLNENVTLRLRSNETMSFYLLQDDEMKKEIRELFESERHKLRLNQIAREMVYSKYFPFFMIAIAAYLILSLIWVFYNINSYRKQKKELIEKERFYLQLENKRLLERYNEVPIDAPTSSERIEDIKNIQISDYFTAQS
uniref:Cell division protein FtsL n=2 Tax=Acrobeloides nanus TaxID=290746 RepID=A0A914CAQ3_9BILA